MFASEADVSDPLQCTRMPRLGRTIPALPVRDVAAAVEHYAEHFGFRTLHDDEAFAVIERDEARIHLWQAADERWRERDGDPVQSGAESFLAGTASCRIEVADPDALFEELRAVLHPVSESGPMDTDFGTREFAALDRDGNLIEFFRWR